MKNTDRQFGRCVRNAALLARTHVGLVVVFVWLAFPLMGGQESGNRPNADKKPADSTAPVKEQAQALQVLAADQPPLTLKRHTGDVQCVAFPVAERPSNVVEPSPHTTMTSPTQPPRSRAVEATWASLGLAFGCGLVFLLGQLVNRISPFEHSPRGLLTGFVPRAILYVLWAGEALAVVIGLASLLLIRRADIDSKAVVGIVAGSLCGIAVGLFGTIFFWLVVGQIVIGF